MSRFLWLPIVSKNIQQKLGNFRFMRQQLKVNALQITSSVMHYEQVLKLWLTIALNDWNMFIILEVHLLFFVFILTVLFVVSKWCHRYLNLPSRFKTSQTIERKIGIIIFNYVTQSFNYSCRCKPWTLSLANIYCLLLWNYYKKQFKFRATIHCL